MATLDGLEGELLRIGSTYSGKWTYALTDMSSCQKIGHRQDDVMPTASLIKVPVLTALYRAVHEGRLRLTDRIRYGHFVWHMFVLMGTVCHFFAVLWYAA